MPTRIPHFPALPLRSYRWKVMRSYTSPSKKGQDSSTLRAKVGVSKGKIETRFLLLPSESISSTMSEMVALSYPLLRNTLRAAAKGFNGLGLDGQDLGKEPDGLIQVGQVPLHIGTAQEKAQIGQGYGLRRRRF